MNYQKKYYKYKNKYINIKKKLGGSENIYTITVKEPWFSFIKEGKKKIEGRLNRGLFQKINKNDIVIWMNRDQKVKVRITDKRVYKNFREMIEKEGLDKVLPSIKTIDDGVNVYRQYFSETDEINNGVVAIEMNVIN